MSNLFWDIATSYLALGLLALVGIAALIIAHVPFGSYLPVIAPYIPLARAVSIVAPAVLFFLVGFRVADERSETARLAAELATVRQEKDTINKAAENDAARAAQAQQRVDELEGKARETPANSALALNRAAARRVRDIR